VVNHADGTRSIHGSGALLKESTRSADRKAIVVRGPNGKMMVKKIAVKQDIVNAGGKKDESGDSDDLNR
jgi:hypothetical protein